MRVLGVNAVFHDPAAALVVDGALVSSRWPDDLPAFCAAIVEAFARGRQTAPAGGA